MTWQETLDEVFPEGLSVTQVEDVPENVSDSYQFLTPRLIVTEENGDTAEVTCNAFEFEKDTSFTLVKLEDFAPGTWLALTPDTQPNFILSTNIDEKVLRRLKQAREEWYG